MAADDGARTGLRLGHKLALAVVVLAALLQAVLALWVAPSTAARFRAQSDALVERSIGAMRQLAADGAARSRELLVDLIGHATEARRRGIADLPLEIYRDPEALRAAIAREDGERGERLRANAATLGAEMRRRDDARVDAVLLELERQQAEQVRLLTDELQRTHLVLCSVLLAIALLMFSFGLWRLVVRPVGRLRTAARHIAGGDLDVELPAASGDELGALTRDFSVMASNLRQSRTELAELNRGLEALVAQKTRELAHAEKMASIGTLAGGIAHEFNNLIGGIKGCAADVRAEETDPDRRETLDVILRAADRAAAIVLQLRRFAQRDAGRRVDLSLERVVGDALRLIEPEARRRGVEVRSQLAGDLDVHGDDVALHQVFVNLLNNALQAMPDGGELTVRGTREDRDHVVVTVVDTGTGIDPGDLDRIFEPFFSRRADAADPAQRGTGLGLSVSYGIVEAHGGTIAVASEVGAGTTMTVRLPAQPRPGA